MTLVNPHGSHKKLTPTLLSTKEREEEIKKAQSLRKVPIDAKTACDVMMLGAGALSPLTGFMGKSDWQGVLSDMKLRSMDPGTLWPLPITLAVATVDFDEGEEIALYEGDELIGTMLVQEIFEADKKEECEKCFMGQGTRDADDFWRLAEEEHPGVQQVLQSGKFYLGGPVKSLSEKHFKSMLGKYYLQPAEARQEFIDRGWSKIAAYHTRLPIHRSQEYLCKIAQEISDGLFIHALVGDPKACDVPDEVRIKSYQVLVENYFNDDHTILGAYPMHMRFAGPREALLHGIIRQNYGCSHLVVGRDHAGIGDFYGLFEAQEIFDSLDDGDLELQAINVDWTFWSHRNNGMSSLKTCPIDDPADRVIVSGTKLRRLLSEGRLNEVPPELSRPEVLDVLMSHYKSVMSKAAIR